jgi:hypothetical protein
VCVCVCFVVKFVPKTSVRSSLEKHDCIKDDYKHVSYVYLCVYND